jgi:hypothetical protein
VSNRCSLLAPARHDGHEITRPCVPDRTGLPGANAREGAGKLERQARQYHLRPNNRRFAFQAVRRAIGHPCHTHTATIQLANVRIPGANSRDRTSPDGRVFVVEGLLQNWFQPFQYGRITVLEPQPGPTRPRGGKAGLIQRWRQAPMVDVAAYFSAPNSRDRSTGKSCRLRLLCRTLGTVTGMPSSALLPFSCLVSSTAA